MESKQNGINYQENKRFLSRLHNSKEEFHKQYEKFYSDKAKAKQLYLQLLSELKKVILADDVENFERFINLLGYITDSESRENLISFYYDEANKLNVSKSTNLLIFITKHNSLNVMKYVLNNNMVIRNFTLNCKTELIPDEVDDAGHTAFYYALRSNNIELTDILIHKWPGNYFVYNLDKLDKILSKAYDELKLKNVVLTKETELYVEDKLVHLRFYSDSSNNVNKSTINSIDNIRERIGIVIENIKSLKEISEVNDKFLFIGKFIAQNISILKQQLKLTYEILPWEEIEFCLISFVSSYIKKQEINLFYKVILNRNRILKYLTNFSKKLDEVKSNLENYDVKKLAILPKINRDLNVAKIIKNNPKFKELYNDYQEIRDIHSLDKISKYVQLAIHANPKERQGQLTIIRSLQVIGEYLKNTLESPKLSNFTSELLLLSLPNNTRKVFMNLRNSLSHDCAVTKRIEIEENEDIEYFCEIQKDTKKIGSIITYILYKNKIKTIKVLLQKIIDSSSLDELKEVALIFRSFELDAVDSKNLNTIEHEMLEKLIKELRDIVTEKSNHEAEILKKMHEIISFEKSKLNKVGKDCFLGARMINILYSDLLDKSVDDSDIRLIKHSAEMTLENMTSRIESQCLKQLAELAAEISRTNKLKLKCENFVEINRLTSEIIYIAKFEVETIKWIEKLKGKLNNSSFIDENKQVCNSYKLTDEEKSQHMALKLDELKNILNTSIINNQLKFPICNSDEKLLAAFEMLILDILSILGSLKKLENNALFLDENTPTLIGKCLRNHLAHDDLLVDILISDPSITIFLNAKKLIAGDAVDANKKIGKSIAEDPVNLKKQFNRSLSVIHNQEKLFAALEAGNLEAVKSCIASGAEIYGRTINLWTALHFAAKGSSIEVLRYVLEQGLDVNVKTDANQSPLHIASMKGNKSIVQLLFKEKCLCINEKDNDGRTPLHYAAKAGCKDIVEMLLKYKAHHNVKDNNGYAPLHYAIKNNHKDVVMILMNKEIHVDENKAYGGHTSLHFAADKGHVDLVNHFLKLKANVAATDDQGATPLHLAALKGHLDVVKLLIAKGSDVKAKFKDGATPLHFAVEYGYKEIAEVLIKHGADPNAYYNNGLYTPLHYAARDGYVELVDVLLKKGAKPMAVSNNNITPLHLATKNGHLQTVDVFFKHGVNVACNPFLHIAIEYGYKELVEYLIDHHADVNAQFINNVVPLHVAAACGQREIADILLSKNVEIDVKDVNGFTPLHAAVDKGHKDVVEFLLNNGADVKACTNTNTTALHIAATNGDPEMADLLIRNKANVNATDCDKVKPLHQAAQFGYINIINSLINNAADINAKDVIGRTALQAAVEAGHLEVVEILIANDAVVNTKNKHNCTTLSSAVKGNYKEIVEILVANGADVNAEAGQPLLYAVLSGFDEIVNILVRNKATINVKYTDNNSLLHMAVVRGYKKVCEALLVNGIDVNAKNFNNVMPLHIAVRMSYEDIVQILLENGADVYAKIKEGLTPLHLAACEGDVDVLELLLHHGVDVNFKDDEDRTPLEMAIAYGCFKAVKVLFHRMKVNINSRSNNDCTFLHIAAQEGNVEIAKYLISNGADIHAKDVFGSKPMHIAAKEGHCDIIELFIDLGLNVNDLGRNNQTPLHYAALSGQTDVAKYLIEHNADLNAKDNNDSTPVHMAAISGYKSFIKVLLDNGAIFNPVDKQNRKPVEITDNNDAINLFNATERLFKAVKQNNIMEVQQCIKAGAFVNSKTSDNVNVLHHASWKGFDEVVKILLQNGANPNVPGKQALTALHYAAKFSHPKVLKVLLANGAMYNTVSEAGKTPLDMAEDKSVINLLKLINESFKNVMSCNSKVVTDIRKLKDVDSVKAIMGTVNAANKSLITLAIHSGFSKVNQLMQIMQDDLTDNVEMAELFIQQEKYKEALKILEKVLKKRMEILGPNNPGTLDIQSRMAKLLYKQQKYTEALSLLEEIYSKQNVVLGTSVKDTLSTKSTIALIMHRQGKSEEALKIYEEVYLKQRETAGIPDADILSTRFHMAVVLEGLGKYEDALGIFNEILEKQKKTMGMRDPETVTTLNNIAALLDRTGKSDEALKVYRKVYETRKMILGPMHTDTLKTSYHMIAVLVHQEKFSEALEAYEELLDAQRTVLGPKNLNTLTTWQSIAQIYIYQGRYMSALKILKSCIGPRRAILGADHPEIQRTEQIIEQINFGLKMDGSQDYVLQNFEAEMKLAIESGDGKSVEYLMKNIVDVNEQDADGRTLLHFAVDLGHADIVNMLLRSGALVTKATNKGNTPLHTATSRGRKDIVELLLKQVSRDKLNEFINARTSANGTAALHVAARNGHYDILKILLKHGAVYDIKNNEGKRPIDFSKDPRPMALLQSIDEMFQRAKRGDDKLVERMRLLKPEEFKATTNTRDHQDKSIVQVALVNKHQQLASKLLKLLKALSLN